ncbi:DUF4232 domain-containing protein [Streptomyces sp. TRM S81-3]|uniref:DUF4232 domain-containing protein n=1 Tax=Streptomyces griseicoloratus TaxID=2752516 RepID=A0A926QUU8_9ACTN|nr:DUF4232 domain-containing protein [Streptomyces griseicoloratus]MBD0423487.1 DUF4232 domain-containing protein [Streptomyces griseicoloratus]
MRTSLPRAALGALAAAVLLGACGTQTAGPGGEGAGVCGAGAAGGGPDSGAGSGAEAGASAQDGVRVVGMVEQDRGGASSCVVAYSVTNQEAEPFTYTITFSLTGAEGGAMSNTEETVASVGAGRTVRRTLEPVPGHADAGEVRIIDVKRVPSDEAPAPDGPCPSSGLRLTADDGDAAMGLRVVGLRLENCGSRPYSLDGYPALGLLDEDHEPVGGIGIVPGGEGIALVGGFDDPPRPVTLDPGEAAVSGLMWRNTTGSGEPVDVPYVRVRALPGADPVMVAPDLDLGTTGKLGVSAWRKDTANGASAPPRP